MPGSIQPYRMAWSFRIGKLFGIDIRVHLIFVAFIILICFHDIVQSGSIRIAAIELFWILLLFVFVLSHELGHSLVAQRAGIRVIDIVLWPLGGLARLKGENRHPMTEFKIAMAGPAVNIAVALAVYPFWHFMADRQIWFIIADQQTYHPLFFVLAVNLALGTFNLVPAFPMDGGRILRALIARKKSYLKATEIAVRVGRLIAWTCLLIAIFYYGNFWLALICLFVLWAGSAELRAVRAREMMRYAQSWGMGDSPTIDAEVISSSGGAEPHAGRNPDESLKDFEKQFIDMIRKHRKDD